MKKITLLLLVMAHYSCTSQKSTDVMLLQFLRNNLNRIELTKLALFPEEIVTLCGDTSFQTQFRRKIELHHRIVRKTVEDQQEYELELHMLYNRLQETESWVSKEGKRFLLELLGDHKSLRFKINEKLIMTQLDIHKRGIVNGYDEGTVAESKFLFICFDPVLIKKALLSNDQFDTWDRTGVFLCNYIRDNENPLLLRGPLRQKILNLLSDRMVKSHYNEVVQELINCDISSNLND